MNNSNLFESFLCTAAGRRATTLMWTHKRPMQEIFDSVLQEVNFAIPFLMVGAKYTTAQLCNPTTWQTWPTAEHRVAGMCLAFFVRERVIGLVLHRTRSGKGTKRYCLPSPQAVSAKVLSRTTSLFTLPGSMA